MLYQLKDVHKSYKMKKIEVNAIKGINLSLEMEKFYSFIGPSGSGKSTLLNMLGLLDEPTKGKVIFDGTDIEKLSEDGKAEVRNGKIGFIFQQYYLIPVLNVYENIEIPLLQNNLLTKQERSKRINDLIEEVGLEKYVRHKPTELSGGQQQRVAIARALVMQPKVVLADEPTANLDSVTGESIIRLMRKLNQTQKTTFIFSTHDTMVMEYCDRIFKIKDGLIT